MKPSTSPSSSLPETGPRYWRSLDDLSNSPEFIEQVQREFGPHASELNEVDRRHFFKIMAASFAIGGVGFSGCRRPEAHILPYSQAPEHIVPGLPLYYASSYSLRGESIPLLVETHTGRPTKIEGNADYAGYGGKTTLKAQGSILDLYDPDRATRHTRGGSNISQAEALDALKRLRDELGSTRGKGAAVLTEKSSSPTRLRLKKEFLKAYPETLWAEYEPIATDHGAKAARIVAGANLEPRYSFAKAERVLSVDGDFLGEAQGVLKFSKEFADGRRIRGSHDKMNRLYAVESNFSLTGAMADHRKRLASSQMMAVLAQVALQTLEIGVEAEGLRPVLGRLAEPLTEDTKVWIRECVADLAAHRGKCLVYVGDQLPVEAHALGLIINEKLGNLRQTVDLVEVTPDVARSITELAAAIETGAISTLFIAGGNPVYNAPADLDFAQLLGKVNQTIRLGYHKDETSKAADYHIVQAHYLESWGDGRTYDGDVVAQQPMILPMFQGLSEIEALARLIGLPNTDGHSLVLDTLNGLGAEGERGFDKFLHDGFLPNSGYRKSNSNIGGLNIVDALEQYAVTEAPTAESLEVIFTVDPCIDDGRYLNNGWLQECPDPMTKLTWDNAIMVSPAMAKKLGIMAPDSFIQVARKNANKVRDGREYAPVYELTVNGRTVKWGVHIQPGLADYTIVLPLGYGRKEVGRIGQGSGFDAYALRGSEAQAFATGATLKATGERIQLANTQEHWSMEGRAIVREANLDYYAEHPDWVNRMGMESHSPPVYGESKDMALEEKITETPRGNSLYQHPDLTGVHQWGMNIDLNVCTGCNACVVACQAENNIPIVGRDQVRRGREMHWIRLDRYFTSNVSKGEGEDFKLDLSAVPEDPQAVLQPVTCMHCETAPCETVCPVNATVHDEEGLNVMAYNRCVGTRYCANNCPYKVRRFNFFDYQQRREDQYYMGPLGEKGMPELVQMAQNPDVSVRMRGVMEKCTYCLQRIQKAKIAQKNKARDSDRIKVPDGTIKTACEQVCPTDAIVFGDLSDTSSRVHKLQENERNYSMLGYLNTRPRTTYLAKVRNPNKKMPDYFEQPLSKLEYNYAAGKIGKKDAARDDKGGTH